MQTDPITRSQQSQRYFLGPKPKDVLTKDARPSTRTTFFLSRGVALHRALALFFIVPVALSTAACGGANYARSTYGTEGGYSLKNAHAKPANLMIARKVDRALYIVLDPARVKNTWELDTPSCAIPNHAGCEHFKLFNVHEFVHRDLKAAMENYFTRVEVVAPGQTPPSSPHVIADVKIDDIKLRDVVAGHLTYTLIEMTWGFAMRRGEDKDYAYSFGGTAESSESYPTFEAGCGQLIENAIPAMLKKWTESGGVEQLRK